MLKLHELVNTSELTSGNGNVNRRLLLFSNMLPINLLRLSHNRVPGKDHTSIEIKLKHSAKPVIIRETLRLTPGVNPPLLSSSLSHTLCLVVHSSNIVGYLGGMHLKHTIVNALCWLTSLRWVVNWRCLLLLLNLLLIIRTIIII
jgi:hypothetical protein